jgi:hypothetical protein
LKYIKENPLKKNPENWEFVGRADFLEKTGEYNERTGEDKPSPLQI